MNGEELLHMSIRDVAKRVAFVAQTVPSIQMTVHDMVMLARALAQQPKVLLLDVPTSSLDLKNQYQVLEIVRNICHEKGITAMIVIHDLNLALRFCDRFLLMKKGEVYGVHGGVVDVGTQRMVLVD